MKILSTILILAGCFLMFACQEDDIKPDPTYFEDYWIIKDDPNDSIQHRTYLIYEKYGVSTFFNDTLAKIYVGQNMDGDSLFRYERIDLNWNFSSESYATPYTHKYLLTPEERMHGLDMVEKYLERIPEENYPYSILLTKSTRKKESLGGGSSSVSNGIFFRTLLMSDVMKYTTEKRMFDYTTKLMNKVLLNSLPNPVILEFYDVLKNVDWYDKKWEDLDDNLPENFDPSVLTKSSASEEQKKVVRDVLGKFGFVSAYENFDIDLDTFETIYFYTTPSFDEQDLQDYITEIITTTNSEFLRRWEIYPLVMQKYNIIKKYIPSVKE